MQKRMQKHEVCSATTEHHHWKILIQSFHSSGYTIFSLDISGFRRFLGLVKFVFVSEMVKLILIFLLLQKHLLQGVLFNIQNK